MSKNILFVASTGKWWDHRYYHKQIPALISTGFNVSYMVREQEGLDNADVNIIALKKQVANNARKTGGLNLFLKIAASDFDAIQICNIELLPLGIMISVLTKKKVFYDCREDHFHAMLHSKVWFPKPVRYLFGSSVKILEYISGKLFKGFIDSDPAIYSMHSFVKDSKKMIFYNMALESQFKNLSLDNKKIDFTVLGSMSVRTGVLDVVKAIGFLKKRGHKATLKLIGDPTFDEELWAQIQEVIKKFDLSDQIKVTGRVPYKKVPLELEDCKIGIIPLLDLPKFRNNIATKQFEYMAAGLPIIASDLPPQNIFIKSGFNGLFYTPGDVEQLAEHMISLYQSDDLVSKLCANGRNMALTEWSSETQQKKYVEFYNKRLKNEPYAESQFPPIKIPQ